MPIVRRLCALRTGANGSSLPCIRADHDPVLSYVASVCMGRQDPFSRQQFFTNSAPRFGAAFDVVSVSREQPDLDDLGHNAALEMVDRLLNLWLRSRHYGSFLAVANRRNVMRIAAALGAVLEG